jgi:dTDP-4-dehydrorhamnose 3,5-epimerase
MRVTETSLPGVLLIERRIYRDMRGAFAESWRAQEYAECGIAENFVQDNVSWSRRGVLRGLHYQNPRAQAKLITALAGTIYDVAVDLRRDSAHFLKWVGAELSADTMRQLYIPAGFAHGFVVTSDHAVVSYKCSDYYSPHDERSVRWNDPQIRIEWPIAQPILSDKDAAAPLLTDLVAQTFSL